MSNFFLEENADGSWSLWHRKSDRPIPFKNVPYDNETGDGWLDRKTAEQMLLTANSFKYSVFQNGEYFTGMNRRPTEKYRRGAEEVGFIQVNRERLYGLPVTDAWYWPDVYSNGGHLEVVYVEN